MAKVMVWAFLLLFHSELVAQQSATNLPASGPWEDNRQVAVGATNSGGKTFFSRAGIGLVSPSTNFSGDRFVGPDAPIEPPPGFVFDAPVDPLTALRAKAERGEAKAQFNLGACYETGQGVEKDTAEAVKWYLKAALQGEYHAQNNLAICYANGEGVAMDKVEAVRWFRKAADQGISSAQSALGSCYGNGEGVPKDYIEAYKWINLAVAQGNQGAKENLSILEQHMTPAQIADAQRLSREFTPRKEGATGSQRQLTAGNTPRSTGTAFFITDDGYLFTCFHVVDGASRIGIRKGGSTIAGMLVASDKANDLALVKIAGEFQSVPLLSSRGVKLGDGVFTVGFPNTVLQGFAPKLGKGEIAALSGPRDDPRYFQISLPVQPGNSGGALVDERGNVVGVVSAKLDVAAAVATSGALPENVNYAVKSSILLSFLESVPEISSKLKEPKLKDRNFEDVVKSAEDAAVLVLVY